MDFLLHVTAPSVAPKNFPAQAVCQGVFIGRAEPVEIVLAQTFNIDAEVDSISDTHKKYLALEKAGEKEFQRLCGILQSMRSPQISVHMPQPDAQKNLNYDQNATKSQNPSRSEAAGAFGQSPDAGPAADDHALSTLDR